ncbi:MAG: LamB/YcsF family protein [Planctomycetes bacterium]|nr:LamB/YcsF family protein [Planctomycetota bacterium]
MHIDLNSDLGEGCGHDEELLPLLTSANICCGFHAGNPDTAWQTLAAAARLGVVVGAHPGFPDREHFGRREIDMPEDKVYRECLYQVGALVALALAVGQPLRYLKPHGALYNMAGRNDRYARPIVAVAQRLSLPLVGLPGSRMEAMAAGHCQFVAEGFADRRYLPDGSLGPRSRPDSMIDNPAEAVDQVMRFIDEGRIQTICVHGDNPQALAFVRGLRQALVDRGVTLRAFA